MSIVTLFPRPRFGEIHVGNELFKMVRNLDSHLIHQRPPRAASRTARNFFVSRRNSKHDRIGRVSGVRRSFWKLLRHGRRFLREAENRSNDCCWTSMCRASKSRKIRKRQHLHSAADRKSWNGGCGHGLIGDVIRGVDTARREIENYSKYDIISQQRLEQSATNCGT